MCSSLWYLVFVACIQCSLDRSVIDHDDIVIITLIACVLLGSFLLQVLPACQRLVSKCIYCNNIRNLNSGNDV